MKDLVALFGLARSGNAAAKALLAAGQRVAAWDDNPEARERAAALGIPLADPRSLDWSGVDSLVLSPGIPLSHPVAGLARAAGSEIIGDIEILGRLCPDATYIGITGTNGKSTTTTLLAHLLRHAGQTVEVGGNLGIAALDLKPLGAGGRYVLEMSSFQLDLLGGMQFDIGILLNISPDHLDRHGDMEGYIAAKMHLFEHLKPGGTAILGIDDDYSRALRDRLGNVKVIPISGSRATRGGIYVKQGMLFDDTTGEEFALLNLAKVPTLPGVHNWQNAAAAYAAARAVKVTPTLAAEGLKSFPGLAHRQEQVAVIGGVTYINDSKATNAAAATALACYDGLYWIAGGKPKDGGITTLEPWFPRIRHAFLIGEAEEDFAATLAGKVPFTRCGTLDRAVKAAHLMAPPGAVVLLSPACASFDQFTDFEHRGNAFRALVETLS